MVPMGVRIGGRGRIAGKQGVEKAGSFSRQSEVQRTRNSTHGLFIPCSLARGEGARLGRAGAGRARTTAFLNTLSALTPGSANDPFHPVVSAAKISVLVILRKRSRHVFSM